MKKSLAVLLLLFSFAAHAEVVCVDGMCYPSKEMALKAGVKLADIEKALQPSAPVPRLAMGLMNKEEMLAFLKNEKPSAPFENYSTALVFLIAILGGLAMNLTPCVLPLIPVNLAIIGAGVKAGSKKDGAIRGGVYALGIALMYGSLGIIAAFGSVAFGTIQSNPWFNAAVAVIFLLLGLSMLDVFLIDFSRFRKHSNLNSSPSSLFAVFSMGALSALLAGACVSPILIASLMICASEVSSGNFLMALLPFALGIGMSLPWPIAGAGIAALPKPGEWMNKVKILFSILIFSFALWYAYLSYTMFLPRQSLGESIVADEENWKRAFEDAKAKGKPIFVDVWATWCKNCAEMERTTLRDKDVAKELSRFTVLKLQAEDFNAFTSIKDFSSLQIKGLPAYIIFDNMEK